MKIVFVTRESYHLAGARVRCYGFAKKLREYGIDTEVFSFADTLGAQDGQYESRIRLADKLRYNYQALSALLKKKDAVFFIQRFNYHALAPWIARLLKGNRVIFDLDDWEMREDPVYHFKWYPSSKAHFLIRMIARQSDLCIAASRFLHEFLTQCNKKAYYIVTGVDTEAFRPVSAKRHNDNVLFSWVGTFNRIEHVKNIAFALCCFNTVRKQYHNIVFEITGDGTFKDKVRALADGYHDSQIVLKDWIHPDAMAEYLNGIDIGLVPVAEDTKFNRAKSPTKLFEYMSMGKATIASSIGEAAHVIDDGVNGLLAGSQESFTQHMRLLIEDRSLRERLGKNARKSAEEKYSLNALGAAFHAILKEMRWLP
jgi:glycosyltransferase involved in cell wall biosynthesis